MLLIVKAKVAIKSVVLVAPVAFALGGAGVAPPPLVPATTVSVAAGSFQYRVAGDFALEGRPVNAPRHDYRVVQSLTFMKTQVSAAEYDRCVADKACERRFGKEQGRADLPVVGVSWQDATFREMALVEDGNEMAAAKRRRVGLRRRQPFQG